MPQSSLRKHRLRLALCVLFAFRIPALGQILDVRDLCVYGYTFDCAFRQAAREATAVRWLQGRRSPWLARGGWTGMKRSRLDRSSWIAVRALGPWHRLVLNDAQVFGHTGPVYVLFGGKRPVVASDVRFYIDWIGRLIDRVNRNGRFAMPARKREVLELFQRALEVYRRIEREAE